jgi:hypothetical protein
MVVKRPTKKYPQFIKVFLKLGPCLAPTLASCLAPHPFLLLIHKVLPKQKKAPKGKTQHETMVFCNKALKINKTKEKGKPNMGLWSFAMKHQK